MQIAYIFITNVHTPIYINNVEFSIEKKPAPNNHKFILKFC